MNLLRRHQAAAAILTLFVFLGVTYSIIVPVFEAPDELYHYPFVAHLPKAGACRIQRPVHQEMWQQEGSQPPLYYVLASALNRWLDLSDLRAIYRPIRTHGSASPWPPTTRTSSSTPTAKHSRGAAQCSACI